MITANRISNRLGIHEPWQPSCNRAKIDQTCIINLNKIDKESENNNNNNYSNHNNNNNNNNTITTATYKQTIKLMFICELYLIRSKSGLIIRLLIVSLLLLSTLLSRQNSTNAHPLTTLTIGSNFPSDNWSKLGAHDNLAELQVSTSPSSLETISLSSSSGPGSMGSGGVGVGSGSSGAISSGPTTTTTTTTMMTTFDRNEQHQQDRDGQSINPSANDTSQSAEAIEFERNMMSWIKITNFVIFLVGLAGNAIVILIILEFTRVETVTDIYILNLAFADLMFVTGILFLLTTMNVEIWVFGNIMCKLIFAHTDDQMTCAIFWPEPTYFECERAFTMFSFAIGFSLPLVLIAAFYINVLQSLRRAANAPIRGSSTRRSMANKRVERLVIVIICSYLLCWVPYWITQMSVSYTLVSKTPANFWLFIHISTSLTYTHSALNPILYAFLSDNFKRRFADVLRSLPTNGLSSIPVISRLNRLLVSTSEAPNSSHDVNLTHVKRQPESDSHLEQKHPNRQHQDRQQQQQQQQQQANQLHHFETSKLDSSEFIISETQLVNQKNMIENKKAIDSTYCEKLIFDHEQQGHNNCNLIEPSTEMSSYNSKLLAKSGLGIPFKFIRQISSNPTQIAIVVLKPSSQLNLTANNNGLQ